MKRTLVMIVALVASAIAAQAGGWRDRYNDRYYGNYDYDRRYLGGRYDAYRYPPVIGGSYAVPGGGCSYYSPSVNHPRYVDPCVGPEYVPPPPPVYYGAPYGGRPRFRGFDLQGPGFGLRLKLF